MNDRIIIGANRSTILREPTRFSMQLVHFATEDVKAGTLKLHVVYYGDVLSNPRIEDYNGFLKDNYDLFMIPPEKVNEIDYGKKWVKNLFNELAELGVALDSIGLMQARFTFVAKSGQVTDFPEGFETMGTLAFDRTLNGLPLAWGSGVEAFASIVREEEYLISL